MLARCDVYTRERSAHYYNKILPCVKRCMIISYSQPWAAFAGKKQIQIDIFIGTVPRVSSLYLCAPNGYSRHSIKFRNNNKNKMRKKQKNKQNGFRALARLLRIRTTLVVFIIFTRSSPLHVHVTHPWKRRWKCLNSFCSRRSQDNALNAHKTHERQTVIYDDILDVRYS